MKMRFTPAMMFDDRRLIATAENRFLGTDWSFVTLHDDRAFWLNERTGTLVPSSKNAANEGEP